MGGWGTKDTNQEGIQITSFPANTLSSLWSSLTITGKVILSKLMLGYVILYTLIPPVATHLTQS